MTNINPLVSIIIPVYNGEDFLEDAIKSALSQTYHNIEVLIINDGSIDNTENIAFKYQNKVRYYRKDNGGVSSALNLGLKMMNGIYFSWLSHDDLYSENKIKEQMAIARKHNFNKNLIIGSSVSIINFEGNVIRQKKGKKEIDVLKGDKLYSHILTKNLNGCSLLLHKEKLDLTNGFPIDYKYIQDTITWANLVDDQTTYIKSNLFLVKNRVHSNQQSVKISHMLKIETKRFVEDTLSNNPTLNNYRIKSLHLFYVKYNGLKGVRKMFAENGHNISLFNLFYIIPISVKYKFLNILKKTYWRIVRFKSGEKNAQK